MAAILKLLNSLPGDMFKRNLLKENFTDIGSGGCIKPDVNGYTNYICIKFESSG